MGQQMSTKKYYMTLPTDSDTRKKIPMCSGLLAYFPAALAGVAYTSFKGNEKHNKGQPLHHAREKSIDHPDCIIRHLVDVLDLQKQWENGTTHILVDTDEGLVPERIEDLIINEVSSLAWRALALSQQIHEQYCNVPMAPGAK
jgi:hypothetical protein